MRTKDKDMAVWMRRADEANLNKLKNLLGQRNGRNVSTPEALGEATRLAIAELERGGTMQTFVVNTGYPRQDGPGPRSWESGYVPPPGTTILGPFTSSAFMHSEPEDAL